MGAAKSGFTIPLVLFASCASQSSSSPQALAPPGEPIAPLVAQLREGDIEAREAAMLGLVALGPDFLTAIREERDRPQDPESVVRLTEVITRLEEQGRLVNFLGRPKLIELAARRIRVHDALKELARLSGVRVEAIDIPENRIDLNLRGVPIWTAVDEVCRAHGRLQPEWSEDRVTIRSGTFRETPSVDWKIGPITMGRFWLEYAPAMTNYRKEPVLESRARLLLSAGKRQYGMTFFLDTAQDGQGQSLFIGEEGSVCLQSGCRFTPDRAVLVEGKSWHPGLRLPSGSVIRNSRGTAYFDMSRDTRRLAAIGDLTPKARSQDPESHVTIYVFEVEREAGQFRIDYQVTYPMMSDQHNRIEGTEGIRLVTGSGKVLYPAEVQQQDMGGSMGASDWVCKARFTLAPDEAIVSLEVMQPAEVVNFRIEFDFPRLPVVAR